MKDADELLLGTPETPEDTTTETETPAETPTVESLQGELAKLKSELEHTQKGLKTAHQTLTTKDKELKRQNDLANNFTLLSQKVDILVQALAERGKTEIDTEDAINPKPQPQTNLSDTFKELDSKAKFQAYQQQVNTMQKQALAAGLGEKDIAYWDIAECARQGQFQKAELLIKQHMESNMNKQTEQIKTQAKEIAERYGVNENELLKFNDVKDMKIYALENQGKKPAEQPAKPKPKYETATPSVMPKGVWQMSKEDFLKRIEQQRKEAVAKRK